MQKPWQSYLYISCPIKTPIPIVAMQNYIFPYCLQWIGSPPENKHVKIFPTLLQTFVWAHFLPNSAHFLPSSSAFPTKFSAFPTKFSPDSFSKPRWTKGFCPPLNKAWKIHSKNKALWKPRTEGKKKMPRCRQFVQIPAALPSEWGRRAARRKKVGEDGDEAGASGSSPHSHGAIS